MIVVNLKKKKKHMPLHGCNAWQRNVVHCLEKKCFVSQLGNNLQWWRVNGVNDNNLSDWGVNGKLSYDDLLLCNGLKF